MAGVDSSTGGLWTLLRRAVLLRAAAATAVAAAAAGDTSEVSACWSGRIFEV